MVLRPSALTTLIGMAARYFVSTTQALNCLAFTILLRNCTLGSVPAIALQQRPSTKQWCTRTDLYPEVGSWAESDSAGQNYGGEVCNAKDNQRLLVFIQSPGQPPIAKEPSMMMPVVIAFEFIFDARNRLVVDAIVAASGDFFFQTLEAGKTDRSKPLGIGRETEPFAGQ
ncbi:uncharacterized protein MCYG_04982 [Microsporum canis CBS 113480]|uniref:Uncharacterized protein n=1 Tax=Arthroderma otae (strain ATCC MYA-4605 / CBS 113480) TaxID=554155 RepID=C5FQL0_ARTOC|nr:uncharacterized protein MCYG_04982 [Microsporum canis CBS 113480]EEQ32163.1 predicted protein [Microsporum canis CBS 113480]